MKYQTLPAAVFDSLVGFYQMRIRPRITGRRVVIAVVAASVVLSWVLAFHLVAATDRRIANAEAERVTERGTKNNEAEVLRESARRKDARISELETENSKLKAEADEARRLVEEATGKKQEAKVIYVQKQIELERELERTSDAITLRRLNCERRKRLGFPCPDDK